MLKKAYDEGFQAALEKFALSLAPIASMGQRLVGAAVRNPNAALAVAGGLGGLATAPEGDGMRNMALGAAGGFGLGRMGAGNALRKGVLSPNKNWLGNTARNYAGNATRMTKPTLPKSIQPIPPIN